MIRGIGGIWVEAKTRSIGTVQPDPADQGHHRSIDADQLYGRFVRRFRQDLLKAFNRLALTGDLGRSGRFHRARRVDPTRDDRVHLFDVG